jgi:hypothetical protein
MIHIPTFNITNHRQQLIVEIEIDAKSKKEYLESKQANPNDPMTLVTSPIQLPKLLSPGDKFKASITTQKK